MFASFVATDPKIIRKQLLASPESNQTILEVEKRYIRLCLLHNTIWRVSRTATHQKLLHDSVNDPTNMVNPDVNIKRSGLVNGHVEGGKYLKAFRHECSSSL